MQQTDQVCPSCVAGKMSVFYRVEDVPVHSCLLVATEQDAKEFPRKDIALGFCDACGFVSNVIFDSSAHNYSPGYEDQQSFSGTFNAFARSLAGRYIERYGLNDKTILEIGCSKGDFLILMCELGRNRGIGIDPSCVPGRVQSEIADDVTFINEHYSEAHSKYQADFICCRHTLEHIPNTAEFVSTVRKSIPGGRSTVVSFELPDVSRVLKELAFWDIYYEHCSYFSLGSLARLFRHCGFEVSALFKEYDDQYLLIDAMPANGRAGERFKVEDDLASLKDAVHFFSMNHEKKMADWRTFIQEQSRAGRKIAIWGSGSKCVAFLTTLKMEDAVDCIVDINPHRHGKYIPGVAKQIRSPESLKKYHPDVVIAMNPIYKSEIQTMLDEMNVSAELTAV